MMAVALPLDDKGPKPINNNYKLLYTVLDHLP